MLDRATRATIVFSDRTASAFMAARTSFSALLIRLPPAARLRSFLNPSSQHSSSCASGPTSFVPAGHEILQCLARPGSVIFLRLFQAAAVFNFLQDPHLAGLGYGLRLWFWVVFTSTVSLTLTLTLITPLTVILP